MMRVSQQRIGYPVTDQTTLAYPGLGGLICALQQLIGLIEIGDCFKLLTSHGAKTTRSNTIGRLRIKSSCTHDNPDYAAKTLSTGHWPWVDNLRFRCPGIALLIGATLYT